MSTKSGNPGSAKYSCKRNRKAYLHRYIGKIIIKTGREKIPIHTFFLILRQTNGPVICELTRVTRMMITKTQKSYGFIQYQLNGKHFNSLKIHWPAMHDFSSFSKTKRAILNGTQWIDCPINHTMSLPPSVASPTITLLFFHSSDSNLTAKCQSTLIFLGRLQIFPHWNATEINTRAWKDGFLIHQACRARAFHSTFIWYLSCFRNRWAGLIRNANNLQPKTTQQIWL